MLIPAKNTSLFTFSAKGRSTMPTAIFNFQISICNALLLLLAGLSLTANAQRPTPAATPPAGDIEVLRTETDLTNLLFTATDKNNRYITTLQQSDIRVLEDSVPQSIRRFQSQTDRRLSIAFLIDVSISEEHILPGEKDAVSAFLGKIMRLTTNEAAVLPFEEYPHVEQPLTQDLTRIYSALEQIKVAFPSYMGSAPPMRGIRHNAGSREGSTAVWDSIALAC